MDHIRRWIARTIVIVRSRRTRRIVETICAIIIVFGLGGYFGAPLLLRHIVTGQLAKSLNRPASVGKISFNPFELKLDVDRFHIGERASGAPFVDIGHLHLRASWTSLFRLAPVVKDVWVSQPVFHIARVAEQRFNFSDLLEGGPKPPPPAQPSKPFRFAISNIQIFNGKVQFDDRVLKEQHAVEHITIDIPFIANLPRDTDAYVEPSVRMLIDGSPLRIAGKAKPFAIPPESVVTLNLDQLDLKRYVAYLPTRIPIKIPSGTLSAFLQIHFVNAASAPAIRLSGNVALKGLDLRDQSNAQLLDLKRAGAALVDVEPLADVIHLGSIKVDGLHTYVVLNRDGTTNLTPLATAGSHPSGSAGSQPAMRTSTIAPVPAVSNAAKQATPAVAAIAQSAATPSARETPVPATAPAPAAAAATMIAASNTPAPQATDSITPSASSLTESATPAQNAAPALRTATGFTLDSFELTDSAINLTDNATAKPAAFAVTGLQVGLKNLRTQANTPPATFKANAKIGAGGALTVAGALDLAGTKATTDISIDELDLPQFQPLAEPFLDATIAAGKFNARASVVTDFAPNHFDVHAQTGDVALDNFALTTANGQKPVRWDRVSATIGQFDLAAHQAAVKEVSASGLRLIVRRQRDGKLNLLALMRTAESPPAENGEASPPRKSRARRRGQRPPQRRAVAPAKASPAAAKANAVAGAAQPWQYQIASITVAQTDADIEDDSAPKPVKFRIAPLNLKLENVSNDLNKPLPLELDGKVDGKGTFKVSGTVAPMPLRAKLKVATRRLELTFANPYVSSRLNATFKSVALTINGSVDASDVRDQLRLKYRGAATVGNLHMLDKLTGDSFLRWSALSLDGIDFNLAGGPPMLHIASVALSNFYARVILNSNGRLNLRDVTANPQAAPTSLTRAQPAAAAAPPTPAPTTEKPIAADIALGQIIFSEGHVNYTDNFIKPNYTADLTQIAGKVGAFGTQTTAPANVVLNGFINDNSPIAITGSINPLTPLAFVDLSANAREIELTNLSPYSTKYTGYPITKGTLTVDVHYKLVQGTLTANNHIFIDQLTFGDKVESPNAINLPIRLAVSLLKNAKGQIDLNVPVSGSLSDPKFSIGSAIWSAFKNLLVKAATSPFSLIASAFGGSGANAANYVAFRPGYATLTVDAKSQLDMIAKALQEHPKLQLTVSGRVDPSVDRKGLPDAMLDRAISQQKLKDSGASGDVDSVVVPPDEYNKYLKQVYKEADFAKPRDLVGLTKSIPPDQMKTLIITNTKVTDGDLSKLADARAAVVRAWLVKEKVDASRVVIGTPKLNADDIKGDSKTTRADLTLE